MPLDIDSELTQMANVAGNATQLTTSQLNVNAVRLPNPFRDKLSVEVKSPQLSYLVEKKMDFISASRQTALSNVESNSAILKSVVQLKPLVPSTGEKPVDNVCPILVGPMAHSLGNDLRTTESVELDIGTTLSEVDAVRFKKDNC